MKLLKLNTYTPRFNWVEIAAASDVIVECWTGPNLEVVVTKNLPVLDWLNNKQRILRDCRLNLKISIKVGVLTWS